jgi:LPXTG-site transpeptidase (sortase) family protein
MPGPPRRLTTSMRKPQQRPGEAVIDPITAAGALLALIAGTALVTYGALTIPARIAVASGPPEAFRVAATQQAAQLGASTPTAAQEAPDNQGQPLTSSAGDPTQTSGVESSGPSTTLDPPTPFPTLNPYGDWPFSGDVDYWLSIPRIRVEAPVMAFSPWEREIDGVAVLRLPVPNSYAVSWDARSAEPGFGGNTVLSGHSNLYGGVFGDLDQLTYGDEVALWSPYGVFSYYVSLIEYIEENNQPLEVRFQNAQWLYQTTDSRVTLITCWPRSDSTQRLIVVATR